MYRAEDSHGHILRDMSSNEYDVDELLADFPDCGPIYVKDLSTTRNDGITRLVTILRPLSDAWSSNAPKDENERQGAYIR